jgi:alpha-amylase
LGDNVVALADVNTESKAVQVTMNNFAIEMITNYTIDGFRIDAAKHVPASFWKSFQAATDIFMIGEVFDTDPESASYVCSFMDPAGLSSVLNYPT